MAPAPVIPASIKSAVDEAARSLASATTETPRLDAEVLMAFLLGWSRAQLFAHWDEPPTEEQLATYRQLVARRADGEPVAYIRQLKEFLGLDFYVDSRVLIPRPETELLVARAIQQVHGRPAPLVVDVGTGSGAIAVGILKSCPGVRLIATDLSENALAVARLNAQRHEVQPEFLAGFLLDPVAGPIDVLVANLPYLSREEYESLLDTSIVYEPRLALTDGADGLRLFDELLAQVPDKLAADGCVLLEIGCGQPAALAELATVRLPGFRPTVFPDYAGLPRMLQIARA
ncbi:MAG TPA: peptide chain release factor N(5)-glutamine methyltransferase [Chloroflexota bacterium]|nr:peptide chain release factor N(5)-glutamine methyltransferase [Chloroflexota bacterium]